MRRYLYYPILFLLSYSHPLFSQNISSGALFLNLPHNAHQHSLGGAADLFGLDSMNINPAGTTLPVNTAQYYTETSLNASRFPGNVLFTNFSFLYWLGDEVGTLAGMVTFLHYGGIDITDPEGNSEGEITAYDIYANFNYSRKIFFGILVGGNVKVIQQKLHTFSATASAIDFGVKKGFDIIDNELWVSSAINNFGTKIKFDQEGSPLPTKVHNAVSFTLRHWLPDWLNLKVGPQFNYFLEGHYNFTWGTEVLFDLEFFDLYLLTKYKIDSAQNQFSFGTGGSYGFEAYKVNLSFGINPFSFGTDLIASIKFAYSFGEGKLSQVKPIDFSSELKNSGFERLGKDPNEIIIQLDEPVFEEEN